MMLFTKVNLQILITLFLQDKIFKKCDLLTIIIKLIIENK